VEKVVSVGNEGKSVKSQTEGLKKEENQEVVEKEES